MICHNVQAAITLAGLTVMLKHMLLMQTLRIQTVLMKKSKFITQLATIMILKILIIKKTTQQSTLHYQNFLNADINVDNAVRNISLEMHCLLIYKDKKQKMKLTTELKNVQIKRSLLLLLLSRQFLTS